MDSVTQIALGAAVGVAVMGRRTAVWKSALWGAVAGTLPDLDAFIDHGDAILNMTRHRAESHALFYLTLAAPAKRLIKQTEEWEGNLVEAPTLIRHDDEYVLFYSANDYASASYAVGAATSNSLFGPYTKQKTPVVSIAESGGRWEGPGGQDVVTTDHGDVLVFHSWAADHIYRGMNVASLVWSRSGVHVSVP